MGCFGEVLINVKPLIILAKQRSRSSCFKTMVVQRKEGIMRNIKYMGKLDSFSQLERGELLQGAVKFREPETMGQIIRQATLISLPVIVISTVILFLKSSGGFFALPFPVMVLNLIILLGLFFVHEFIHALSLPAEVSKEIWTKFSDGVLLIHFDQPIRKSQFLWLSLAPNVILGLVPFSLYALGLFDMSTVFKDSIGFISWMMLLGGVGDYLNVFNALRQVPKDAKVFNYGIHSYWLPA